MMVGVLAALAVPGCVTIPSKVVEIGPNTYSLNVTGAGLTTQGGTNIKALSQASDFCAGLHKHLLVDQSTENGVYGWSPRQATLKFRCLDADDPEYANKATKSAVTTPR